MKRSLVVLVFLIVNFLQMSAQDLLNLDPVNSFRFEVKEKSWPLNFGDAEVCLWNDDKLAAFTITIDDNNESDIPFWKEMISEYGFNLTWFVITEASTQYNVKNWSLFNELANLGSQINGHDDKNWNIEEGITNEGYLKRLQSTITKINSELSNSNNNCLTYAYPYGEGSETLARELFISIRGTKGILNNSSDVNYLNVNSISNGHIYGNDENRDNYILPLLNKENKLWGVNYYRGWGSTHFHSLSSEDSKKTATEFLEYLASKPDLWVAGFTEVSQYSQSYATHQLKVDSVTKDEVKFTLMDSMLNSAFYYPLSVKVKIENDWSKVIAIQNNESIDVSTILHKGEKFAIVKVVPDLGQVTLVNNRKVDDDLPIDEKLKITPNPIKENKVKFSCGMLKTKTKIEIYSLLGVSVFCEEIEKQPTNEYEITVGLNSGVYLLKLSDSDCSEVQRIVIP